MEISAFVTIQDLPEEVFEKIFIYFSDKDLHTCFNVCEKWRHILNSNEIWKRFCFYPEKFFKADTVTRLKKALGDKVDTEDMCLWKQYYHLQESVWLNLSKRRFSVTKSGIHTSQISYLTVFVDDLGQNWLFNDNGKTGITVWNITGTPYCHDKISETGHFSFWHMTDKMITFRANYVKVFQFSPPEYKSTLLYRFRFNMDKILPRDEVVPDNEYMSGVRYILLDHYFIGYKEDISCITAAYLHIWDFNLAKKIAMPSAFQESFADYIRLKTGTDVTITFSGGLLLFTGSSKRFLVNLIDDRYKLCQVSLFSLDEMNFVRVIAQIESRTAWCFMKNEIIAIHHRKASTSTISVYNTDSQLLAQLPFPFSHNPAFSDEFWFTGSKVILKTKNKLDILTIDEDMQVKSSGFETDKGRLILSFYEPKYLLLYDKEYKPSRFLNSHVHMSLWDIECGTKLWELTGLVSLSSYRGLLQDMRYPGKLVVLFSGDEEFSILNFEEGETKLEELEKEVVVPK